MKRPRNHIYMDGYYRLGARSPRQTLDQQLKRLGCPPRTNEVVLPVERRVSEEVMRNDTPGGGSKPVEKPRT